MCVERERACDTAQIVVLADADTASHTQPLHACMVHRELRVYRRTSDPVGSCSVQAVVCSSYFIERNERNLKFSGAARGFDFLKVGPILARLA